MSGNKLYSQEEIRALLQKATELQKNAAIPDEVGLTLDEIEQIARDSGIDPSYIREAISARATQPPKSSKFYILGAPVSLEVGKEIPYQLSEDDWQAVVQEARRSLNKNGGAVQKLGNSFEWINADKKFIHVSLTATPSKDKTRFFVSTHFEKLAFMTFYVPLMATILFLVGFLNSTDFSLVNNLIIPAGTLVTVFSATRFGFGAWVSNQKKKLEKMISRFELIIGADDKERKATEFNEKPSITIPEEEKNESNNTLNSSEKNRTRT